MVSFSTLLASASSSWFVIAVFLSRVLSIRFVGITGGIASGKSTMSSYIRKKYRATVIDFDVLSRAVVEPGKKAYKTIVKAFGSEILCRDGTIDRKKLGQICFNNKAKLKILTNAVNFQIIKLFAKHAIIHFLRGKGVLHLEVALLCETKLNKLCSHVVVVDANSELQMNRMLVRDDVDVTTAEQKIQSQWRSNRRNQFADTIIYNNTRTEDFYHQIDDWWAKYNKAGKRWMTIPGSLMSLITVVLSTLVIVPIQIYIESTNRIHM